jgi:hypothetical protein
MLESSHDHGLAMTSASQLRVSDHVLQEPVAPSAAEQIGCNDQHAGRRYTITLIGYEDADSRLAQAFSPDALGSFSRLSDGAHLRHLEQREEG